MLLIQNFDPTQKIRKAFSYQVTQIYALFGKLIALTLGSNSFKSLKVTKIVQEIKFERVSDKL